MTNTISEENMAEQDKNKDVQDAPAARKPEAEAKAPQVKPQEKPKAEPVVPKINPGGLNRNNR